MRLQKQKTREVKGKEYFRWTVVIPPNEVNNLGWDEGMQLESAVEKDKLILQRSKVKKASSPPQ